MTAIDILRDLNKQGFSLSVHDTRITVVPASKLTDDIRSEIRTHKAEIMALLAANDPEPTAYAWLLTYPSGACVSVTRTPPCSLAEIQADYPGATVEMDLGTLTASPALHYASTERLADDRHTCQQCANLTNGGRCLAASRGELPEYPRGYEPDPNWLHRCDGFKSRAGSLDPPRATAPALHPHDEKIARALLAHWRETDPVIRDEYLDGIARDPVMLGQMLDEAVRLGLAVPAPEPVTERAAEDTAPKAVCARCQHWTANPINPIGGLGRCRADAPASLRAFSDAGSSGRPSGAWAVCGW